MKKHWWKILGVILLVYSFLVGMLVPLKPGIVSASPANFKTGDRAQIMVEGYNTFYQKGEVHRAWLKLADDQQLAAQQIQVISDTKMKIDFVLPVTLPGEDKVMDATLILDNMIDGATVLPSAIFITRQENDGGGTQWQNNLISDLHEKSGMTFPYRNILSETIRSTYYHVPYWFAMMIIFVISMVYSIQYLSTNDPLKDHKAAAFTSVGVLYGVLGLVTGAIWAKFTWGSYWSFDIKQNMAAIAMLVYLAYFVLRASFEDEEKKARISAVYNIFAFACLVPLLFVIPRLTDSLHPGNGGNPGFGGEDLDNTMRLVLYPAVIGWILVGTWMANLLYRMESLKEKIYGF
ncbi:MAG: cytochrome c biogenesis protein CcsA [Bacteroidota bacterium]